MVMREMTKFEYLCPARRAILDTAGRRCRCTSQDAHEKPIEQLVNDFESHLERGLTRQEAARVSRARANELSERPRPGFIRLLWDQFNNYLVIILIVAAVISFALGEWVDSIAIFVIVALNAIVGVIQESKAEQALAALNKMAAPNAQVIRDGHQLTVPGREIVGGDIVLLEAGNFVPADRAPVRELQPEGRGGLADRRIRAGREESRRRARPGNPAGRSHATPPSWARWSAYGRGKGSSPAPA